MSQKWLKHVVRCQCYLQQFKNSISPPQHEFIVFSVYDNYPDSLIKKYAQCNNCGVIHEIDKICSSKILHKDELRSIRTLEEIKLSLPDKILFVLDKHNVDYSTYEAVEYILQQELWGDRVLLTKDVLDTNINVKYLNIFGKNLFKVDTIENEIVI